MFSVFLQPYPAYNVSQKQIGICVLSGLIIFMILYVMQPFSFNLLPEQLKLRYAIIHGVITLLILLLLTVIAPILLPKIFNENHWNVGSQMVMIFVEILSVAVANSVANQFLYGTPFTIKNVGAFVYVTAVVGLLPILVATVINQKVLLKRYQKQSENLRNHLPLNTHLNRFKNDARDAVEQNNTIDLTPQVFQLVGDNQSERFQLDIRNLWLITSSDNYVSVIYKKNEKFETQILRSTLKKMESQLSQFPEMVRCHRGFIINSTKIEDTVASAQGLKLKLIGQTDLVPVSKMYLETKYTV